jgi:hypothetical protein
LSPRWPVFPIVWCSGAKTSNPLVPRLLINNLFIILFMLYSYYIVRVGHKHAHW